MTVRVVVAFTAVSAIVTMCASSAAAQTFSPRGYVTFGSTVSTSTDSFEAVTGESSANAVGGGGSLNGIWRGMFVDGGISQHESTGERVFIDRGTTYRLGIPVTVRTRPFDLAGGWRFVFGRFSPYAGGGMSMISYKETSDFAASDEDVSESKTGGMFLAGVDVAIIRWLHAGGEFRYRAVKGVLGEGGVSEVFGEDQLGGYAFGVRISVGR